ncbi:MAG: ATP-binding protein [Clostridiaceae bacterium]
MNINKGVIRKAQKIVLYAVEGIGKSTFASQAPGVLFIDTEDSTAHMDVARFDRPSSWTMLQQQVAYVKSHPGICQTLAVDTADWAEKLAIQHIVSGAKKTGIEDFGYGKGYTYLEEEFGKFLNSLQNLIEIGINIIVVAHAEIKKVEQPEEVGGYDHWQMKLEKKTMPLLKEWADILLFANYKTMVINVDNQGATKGKNIAQGNKRIMYTTRSPWWDAKNRHDLPDELPFEFRQIAHILGTVNPPQVQEQIVHQIDPPKQTSAPVQEMKQATQSEITQNDDDIMLGIKNSTPKALADLMRANHVSVPEIQEVVGQKGYYPADTPIANYDPGFIAGVLVGAWDQVYGLIKINKDNMTIPY